MNASLKMNSLFLRISCFSLCFLQSGHATLLFQRTSVARKKPEMRIPSFLVHVGSIMDEIWDDICVLGEQYEYAQTELNSTCERVDELVNYQGKRFWELLPDYLYADYKALAIANSLSMELGATRREPVIPEAPKYFATLSRVHRALGYGNTLLMLGYPRHVVETAYVTYYNTILEQQDSYVPTQYYTGLLDYCSYINVEYEQLKDYARQVTSSLSTPTIDLDYTMMYLCSHRDLTYWVKSDWERSRREFLAALMTGSCAPPISLYLILHWESLYISQKSSEDAYDLFLKSFDVLLGYINMNNNTFSCA